MKKRIIILMGLFIVLIGALRTKILGVRSIWNCGKRIFYDPFVCITSQEKAVYDNPYAHLQADIRVGNELCEQEQEYLKNRNPKIKKALEEVLNISLDNKKIPVISVICSGGGYRALLGSVGAWYGLEKLGLLDAVTYISTLSGSTWALGLWMSTHISLSELKQYVSKRLTTNFYSLSKRDRKFMARMLLVKIAFKQPFSSIDLFGGLLAKHLLSGYFNSDYHMVHLSEQCKVIQNGELPFPIYTAIDGRLRAIDNPAWYEFTPFEIGSIESALYIPTWAFGRRFNEGKSIDYAPEQSLGFLFGIFGSAFGAHVGLAWNRVIQKMSVSPIKLFIKNVLEKTKIANIRVFWAKVYNFMYGCDIEDNDLKKRKYLKLIDAGIEYNLPYPPVSGQRLERKPDILFFFDFSRSTIPYALERTEEYARKKGLKFPEIDYTNIEKKTISIFKDPLDKTVPVVIYMPRVSDPCLWESKKEDLLYKKYRIIEGFNFDTCARSGVCNTLNFKYESNQSQQVMKQMEFNVVANADIIISTLHSVIENKDNNEIH